jgi:CheY-like chemotaxis protein
VSDAKDSESVSAVDAPVVLLLSEDLFFVPGIQDSLRELGCQVFVVDDAAKLGASGAPSVRDVPLTEPLDGADAIMMRRLAADRPALMLVDLTAENLPWARWIQVLKTSAATRRIPIVAFGPHVDKDRFSIARRAGADEVLPRGQISKKLPRLVERLARMPDNEALSSSCGEPLSNLAQEGIRLHNVGKYFEAHELLEEAWLEEEGESGYLYRALLQVAVTHLHLVRGNLRGAKKMMLRIHQWLDPLPPLCRGIDVRRLRSYVEGLRRDLNSMDADELGSFDTARLSGIPLAAV